MLHYFLEELAALAEGMDVHHLGHVALGHLAALTQNKLELVQMQKVAG